MPTETRRRASVSIRACWSGGTWLSSNGNSSRSASVSDQSGPSAAKPSEVSTAICSAVKTDGRGMLWHAASSRAQARRIRLRSGRGAGGIKLFLVVVGQGGLSNLSAYKGEWEQG